MGLSAFYGSVPPENKRLQVWLTQERDIIIS